MIEERTLIILGHVLEVITILCIVGVLCLHRIMFGFKIFGIKPSIQYESIRKEEPTMPFPTGWETIMPGDKVSIMHMSNIYATPKARPATVTKRYGKTVKYYGEPVQYPDLVDVVFDDDGKTSIGHFTHRVALLSGNTQEA